MREAAWCVVTVTVATGDSLSRKDVEGALGPDNGRGKRPKVGNWLHFFGETDDSIDVRIGIASAYIASHERILREFAEKTLVSLDIALTPTVPRDSFFLPPDLVEMLGRLNAPVYVDTYLDM